MACLRNYECKLETFSGRFKILPHGNGWLRSLVLGQGRLILIITIFRGPFVSTCLINKGVDRYNWVGRARRTFPVTAATYNSPDARPNPFSTNQKHHFNKIPIRRALWAMCRRDCRMHNAGHASPTASILTYVALAQIWSTEYFLLSSTTELYTIVRKTKRDSIANERKYYGILQRNVSLPTSTLKSVFMVVNKI